MKTTCGILTLIVALTWSTRLGGQSKPALTPADYGQFETLVTMPNRGGLSPDGRYLAYGINRANRENELRVLTVADGTVKVAAFGLQPVFSADSRWVAYGIGLSEAQEEKLRKDKKPIRRKLGLLNLSAGQTTVVDEVESFAFNAGGTHLAMRRYAPERKESGEAPAENEGPAPATVVVRELASGRDTTFGNIGEFAWQDSGPLLALTVSAENKVGNGVQLFDPASGALRVLDSAASAYSGLAWRKNADDLAVLRSRTDDRHDGPTHVVLAWKGVGPAAPVARVFDPTANAAFPAGMRIASFRKPSWSEDGRIVFVGVGKWIENAVPARRTTTSSGVHATTGTTKVVPYVVPYVQQDGTTKVVPYNADEEPAGVDVWHSRDVDVMPRQKIQARADRERTLLAAWHVESGTFVPLAKDFSERVAPVKRQPFAYAENWTAYAMDRSIGRPAADVSLVDLATGARTKLRDRIDDGDADVSPAGRYVIYLQDDHIWTIDLKSRAAVNITKGVATTFIDRESDQTTKQKPAFGVAGWLANDEAVLLYDRFDIWRIAPDGSRASRITDGAAEQVRHRIVRLNADDEFIDAAKPIYVSLFGTWSKKSGYGVIRPGAAAAERLVWGDKNIRQLARAKDADVFAYTSEAYDDSPDVFVGADLKSARQITTTNPFQDRFAWGRGELIEYRTERGDRLQGALFYPANYEAGKRYPMIIAMYERLSDGIHRYVPPSDRAEQNTTAFTSRGYLVLQPDIVFRPREPGLSVADCVGSAIKKVVQMGVVNPQRIGAIGHSWGGFDTTFLVTHTDLFAAGVAGAPITNLVSNYGNHHWSSGIAETDHIETGQQRMEVPLWEDLQAYIRNSAVFGVQNMKTPLLIEVGDNDGTVHWHQGVELYNLARRAKKDVVLLQYAGEDHGLRKKANQLDYHRRIVEWFGHYLKDEPAAPWITSGVSHLDREQELKAKKSK